MTVQPSLIFGKDEIRLITNTTTASKIAEIFMALLCATSKGLTCINLFHHYKIIYSYVPIFKGENRLR